MFERYTEKARRVIFFARYEARAFGSPYIESEHMLLGLLREDKPLSLRFITPLTSAGALRMEIEQHTTVREKVSTSVDIPLSNECKHILAYAAEEAELLAHPHIGTGHLFLGILREQNCFASELLRRHGIHLEDVRKGIAESEPPVGPRDTPRAISNVVSVEPVLKVANLAASIAFYTKLGFHLIGDRGAGTAIMKVGLWALVLDQNLDVKPHLSFRSSDIIPIVEGLQSVGIQFEQPPHTKPNGIMTAVVRDPDGHILSFSSPPRFTPPTPAT